MAKVFLDTNYFIDAVHRKPEKQILDALENHIIYISTLSFHIYCYAFKIKIPNKRIIAQKEKFQAVEFSEDILEPSLNGPPPDFDPKLQRLTAATTDCDIFLTS